MAFMMRLQTRSVNPPAVILRRWRGFWIEVIPSVVANRTSTETALTPRNESLLFAVTMCACQHHTLTARRHARPQLRSRLLQNPSSHLSPPETAYYNTGIHVKFTGIPEYHVADYACCSRSDNPCPGKRDKESSFSVIHLFNDRPAADRAFRYVVVCCRWGRDAGAGA